MSMRLLENYAKKNLRSLSIKNVGRIYIAIVPVDEIDEFVDYISDEEFLELAKEYGDVYSVKEFEDRWNNYDFDYVTGDSYIRLIKR